MFKIQFPKTTRSNYNRRKKKRFPPQRKRSWHKTLARYWQYFKWRLLRLQENPQRIARGFAAGVFAGCFPLMGLQFLFSLVIAILIKGNKLAAFMGTWISNPFTYVPIFLLNFQVGKIILGLFIYREEDLQFAFQFEQNLADLGQEITIALLLGSTIVGLFCSSIAYYLILSFLKKWRKH